MSNRSLFPEAVEVHQRDITYSDQQRDLQIKQALNDVATNGVVSGLEITVNVVDATKIDIASGYAYTPRGDLCNLSSPQTALSLASGVLNALNYVCLVYDEVQSLPEAHETDGTTRYTRAVGSPRVVILDALTYGALPANSDVLQVNALDRIALIGIVTGTGGNLTSTAISKPSTFFATLQISQPSNTLGVKIIAVSSTTPTGTGTLSYNYSTHTATWQAPGEGTAGVPTTFTNSGVYTLVANGGSSIVVNVTYSILPSISTSDTLTVSDLYAQSIPRFTADDSHHRSMMGSGVPTSANPHGMTLDDLSEGASGTLEGHQDLEHSNGIVRSSNPNCLAGSVTIDTGVNPDTLSVTNFAAGDVAYVNGRKIEALISSNTLSFLDGSANAGTYGVYLNQDAIVFKQQIAQFPSDVGLSDKIQILDVQGFTAGTYNLVWTAGSPGTISFAGGQAVAPPSTSTVNGVKRLYGSNGVSYIDVYVRYAATQAVTETEVITISSKPAAEDNIPLCNVPWSGSNDGMLGYGFGTHNAPNGVWDTRQWGTISEAETRKDAGMINAQQFIAEVFGDGIVPSRGITPSSWDISNYSNEFVATDAYPNVAVSGGVAYIGGHRYEAPAATLTYTNNSTNIIYINSTGIISIYAGTLANFTVAMLGAPAMVLYQKVISGGVVTGTTDYRVYIGARKDVNLGTVGLGAKKQASVQADDSSVSTLTVTGTGAGYSPALSVSSTSGNALSATTSGVSGVAVSGTINAGLALAAVMGIANKAAPAVWGNTTHVGGVGGHFDNDADGKGAEIRGGNADNTPVLQITNNAPGAAGTVNISSPGTNAIITNGSIAVSSTTGRSRITVSETPGAGANATLAVSSDTDAWTTELFNTNPSGAPLRLTSSSKFGIDISTAAWPSNTITSPFSASHLTNANIIHCWMQVNITCGGGTGNYSIIVANSYNTNGLVARVDTSTFEVTIPSHPPSFNDKYAIFVTNQQMTDGGSPLSTNLIYSAIHPSGKSNTGFRVRVYDLLSGTANLYADLDAYAATRNVIFYILVTGAVA